MQVVSCEKHPDADALYVEQVPRLSQTPTPPRSTIGPEGTGLLQGPTGGGVLMSEVTLYWKLRARTVLGSCRRAMPRNKWHLS